MTPRERKLLIALGALALVGFVVLPIRWLTPLVALGLVGAPSGYPMPDAEWGPLVAAAAAPPDSSTGLRDVPLHPPSEYDGMRRSELLARRTERVREHPEALAALASKGWHPSHQVFSQITDGRPWWGLIGIANYGRSATRSIEGDSEESRFVENPLLLFAPLEVWAHSAYSVSPEPTPLWPRVTALAWDFDRRVGRATVDATSYFRDCAQREWPDCKVRQVRLTAYNAVDYGLFFYAFDRATSHGLDATWDHALREVEFIHTGGSCGHAGGCNNASPEVQAFLLTVRELPARLVVRLWREEPATAAQAPDAWFLLQLD